MNLQYTEQAAMFFLTDVFLYVRPRPRRTRPRAHHRHAAPRSSRPITLQGFAMLLVKGLERTNARCRCQSDPVRVRPPDTPPCPAPVEREQFNQAKLEFQQLLQDEPEVDEHTECVPVTSRNLALPSCLARSLPPPPTAGLAATRAWMWRTKTRLRCAAAGCWTRSRRCSGG